MTRGWWTCPAARPAAAPAFVSATSTASLTASAGTTLAAAAAPTLPATWTASAAASARDCSLLVSYGEGSIDRLHTFVLCTLNVSTIKTFSTDVYTT